MKVPLKVRQAAALSLDLKKAGFDGGTQTGFGRAKQLVAGEVDDQTVRTMHAWFARHRVTSLPGYVRWVEAGSPSSADWPGKHNARGAVAWLLWGGDPGYEWIRSEGECRLRARGISFNPLPALYGLTKDQERKPTRSPKKPARSASPKKSPRRRRRSCGCSA